MTPAEFMSYCVNSGLAGKRTVELYIEQTMKEFYTEEDIKEMLQK